MIHIGLLPIPLLEIFSMFIIELSQNKCFLRLGQIKLTSEIYLMSPISKITSFDQEYQVKKKSKIYLMGRSPEQNNISKNNKICTYKFIHKK